MNELIVSKTTHKVCKGCDTKYECNLENFPKNSTTIREGIRVTYLKASCWTCWRKRPNKIKATKKQFQVNALKYYHKNKDSINKKRRKMTIVKNLNKFLTHKLEKEKWKNTFKVVITDI